MATKKCWLIVGYDSTKKIYEDTVPFGAFSEKQISNLLQVLTARAGLTYNEIVDSYSSRDKKRYRPMLELRRQTRHRFILMCGINPYFLASVIEK
jgi:hypothetical protein